MWGIEPKKLELYEKKYIKIKKIEFERPLFCSFALILLHSHYFRSLFYVSQSLLNLCAAPFLTSVHFSLWQKLYYISHIVYRGMDNSNSLLLLQCCERYVDGFSMEKFDDDDEYHRFPSHSFQHRIIVKGWFVKLEWIWFSEEKSIVMWYYE